MVKAEVYMLTARNNETLEQTEKFCYLDSEIEGGGGERSGGRGSDGFGGFGWVWGENTLFV